MAYGLQGLQSLYLNLLVLGLRVQGLEFIRFGIAWGLDFTGFEGLEFIRLRV